ncbi:hypothetical protein NQZ68_037195 [Dissostichus eleginoides]|nr:hypothetical protein NQZ68_037195 [Dissostichus eleginoides]
MFTSAASIGAAWVASLPPICTVEQQRRTLKVREEECVISVETTKTEQMQEVNKPAEGNTVIGKRQMETGLVSTQGYGNKRESVAQVRAI